MVTTVPSRFAVLSIDEDDYKPKKPNPKKAAAATAPAPAQSSSAKQSSNKNKNDKSSKPGKKDEKKKPNKKKQSNTQEHQQWEQWKEKDLMAVEESYKSDLHHAILLSKLSFEATSNEAKKEASKKISVVKKPKKSTMSLNEFIGSTSTNSEVKPKQNTSQVKTKKEQDTEYFERLDKEAKEEIIKSKEKSELKSRLNVLDEDLNSAQLKVEIEKRDDEIKQLQNEVATLKQKLSQVKERNKKLCQILGDGEMKDKASVLVELVKLQEIRDELTKEVSSLHTQLEQERSKTRASSTDLKNSKQSNKKRSASENA